MAGLHVTHIIGTKTTIGKQDICDDSAIHTIINHCLDAQQTPHKYYGAYNVNILRAASELRLFTEATLQATIRLRHFHLVFSPDEKDWLEREYKKENINSMLYVVADDIARYCAKNYQVIYAMHEDIHAPHIHIVMNTRWCRLYPEDGYNHNYYGCIEYIDSYLNENYGMYLQAIQYEE